MTNRQTPEGIARAYLARIMNLAGALAHHYVDAGAEIRDRHDVAPAEGPAVECECGERMVCAGTLAQRVAHAETRARAEAEASDRLRTALLNAEEARDKAAAELDRVLGELANSQCVHDSTHATVDEAGEPRDKARELALIELAAVKAEREDALRALAHADAVITRLFGKEVPRG